jgi:hypothetical protein
VRGIAKHTWQKIWQPRPVTTRIAAFEAKLRDWKKALFQAERYKDFANETSIVIDASNVGPVLRNLDEFRVRNIGVIACASDGWIEVVHAAQSASPRSPEKYWLANCLIAKEASRLELIGRMN